MVPDRPGGLLFGRPPGFLTPTELCPLEASDGDEGRFIFSARAAYVTPLVVWKFGDF
jgi:hypothetical protein